MTEKKQEPILLKEPTLNMDFISFQSAFTQPKLNATNPFYKNRYADLASIITCLNSQLYKYNLSFIQKTVKEEEELYLRTVIMHVSGENINVDVPMQRGTESQKQGSALTYARRYGLCSAFGVVADEDDDGNAASPNKKVLNKAPDGIYNKTTSYKIEDLLALIEQKGSDGDALCAYFHVSALQSLDQADINRAFNILSKRPDKAN